MKFSAVGDVLIHRRLPATYDGFERVCAWLAETDARYFNLETTLHREGECFGSAFNGGSYQRANPEVLDDCKRFGFNMTGFCNNHTLDYAYDGLLKTLEHVSASGLVHAGVGKNLAQASAPGYLDTVNGRVAIINMTASCNSVFNDICIAGQQSRRVPGRPGVNQLRYKETLFITPEQMAAVKEIAAQTSYNAQEDISRREGYRDPLPAGEFKFGKYVNFKESDHAHKEVTCNSKDLARLDSAIREARFSADYVIFGIHCHEVGGDSKEQPPEFLVEAAHFAIDHGADAVVGHGPHLLRPVELYKGKPIFYSLGDFVLHNESIPFAPEDDYEKQGLTSDANMHDLFAARSKNFTRGLQTDRRMFESVIPRWETENGKLVKLELLPVELGFGLPRSRNGLPAPAKDDSILHRLAELSAPYGTKMHIENGIAAVVL